MEIYILRPFDKNKGIMTDIRGAFVSTDALLDYLEAEGKVSDEFGRVTGRENLKEYIIGDNAILKVENTYEELLPLINIESTVDYYHVSCEKLHE